MSKASSRRGLAPEVGSLRLSHSQNFIRDPALVRRLLGHMDLGGVDTIIEIGPGRGAITLELARLSGVPMPRWPGSRRGCASVTARQEASASPGRVALDWYPQGSPPVASWARTKRG